MESKTNYVDLVASLFLCFCKVLTTNGSSQGPASESVFGSTMGLRLGRFEVAAGPWHEPFCGSILDIQSIVDLGAKYELL